MTGLVIIMGAWVVLVGPFGEEEWEWASERGREKEAKKVRERGVKGTRGERKKEDGRGRDE